MPKLPQLNGREVVRVFERLGGTVDRQSSTHIVLTKVGESASLSVPDHKEVAKGTLRSLIWPANLTVEEFTDTV